MFVAAGCKGSRGRAGRRGLSGHPGLKGEPGDPGCPGSKGKKSDLMSAFKQSHTTNTGNITGCKLKAVYRFLILLSLLVQSM